MTPSAEPHLRPHSEDYASRAAPVSREVSRPSYNGTMHAHPVFADLLLHSDDELALALQSAIVERETIHAWPLSCVQRLCLADGTRLIYKSQLPPTVEPTFYARAASPLLPGQRTLGELGRCVTMVLDWIEAPLLRDVAHSAAEFVDHGRRVVDH